MIKRTRGTLSNGLNLVVIEVPGSKSAETSFWTKAGTRLNPRGKEGLAHFLEHMLLKKSKKYQSSAKLADVLERVGASHNGTTSRDYVHFDIYSASKDIPLTLEVLSEIISNPLIDKKDTDSEREVIRKEQIRTDSNPGVLLWDVWFKIFFAGSPLEFSNLGTPESVKNISKDDLYSFWNETLLTKDSVLFVSSGERFEKVRDLSEKHFGEIKLRSKLNVPYFEYLREKRLIIEKKDLPQVNIFITFATEAGDKLGKNLYSFVVLRNILSGGWHSRISQRLRIKEGLIYSWGSTQERFLDTGAYTLSIPTAIEKLGKVLAILSEEIKKIKDESVSKDELDLAKGFIEGVNLRSHETSGDYLDWYAKEELLWPSQSETIEEFISKTKKVSAKDIQNLTNKYLRQENCYIAIVGDVKVEDVEFGL